MQDFSDDARATSRAPGRGAGLPAHRRAARPRPSSRPRRRGPTSGTTPRRRRRSPASSPARRRPRRSTTGSRGGSTTPRRWPSWPARRATTRIEAEIDAAIAVARRASSTQLELRALFTGEHDERDAMCEVHSGAGGTDAQDWAEMLLRMYLRWAERRGFDVELDEVHRRAPRPASRRPRSSSRAATPTGWLRAEQGVHRLVRISPFDAQRQRQTAFAVGRGRPVHRRGRRARSRSTRRTCASTPTARRAPAASTSTSPTRRCASPTCRPASSCRARTSAASTRTRTGRCRSSRPSWPSSSARSARTSWPPSRGEQQRVDFGSQIRSYVLQPYQQVKDLRTEHEVGQRRRACSTATSTRSWRPTCAGSERRRTASRLNTPRERHRPRWRRCRLAA